MEFLIMMGVPTAATGLLVWWFKRQIDKKDAVRREEIAAAEAKR